MSQDSAGTSFGAISASLSEKSASSATPSSTQSPAPTKPRSCVICRQRKVRCDRRSPCGNCRRANIPCILPSTDKPPRWARHLERPADLAAPAASSDHGLDVGGVVHRLRDLEATVKTLTAQLHQARSASSSHTSAVASIASAESPAPNVDTESLAGTLSTTDASTSNKEFGRLVTQDTSRSRYVSSGFWSRIDDELHGLKIGTYHGQADEASDSSEEEPFAGEAPHIQHFEQTPAERGGFFVRHALSSPSPNLRELHPLPCQVPFLLEKFSENVNLVAGIVHVPTVTKMLRESRGAGVPRLTPADEALAFSIYYATINSMEEDEVMTNFGTAKADLSTKYRLGLEHALTKADFLVAPDIILIQAFALFLLLARRHDNPRFVWMMTGLIIRMAQYLGLQRDGSHFGHLTPFEIEMRRRVWWALCILDVKASEDQGTDLAIADGSFDTKIPLNINDADISPQLKHTPAEHYNVTDMTFVRATAGLTEVTRRIMAFSKGDSVADLDTKSHLVDEIYQRFEYEYFQHTTGARDDRYAIAMATVRLVMAKLTLLSFLPVLSSSPGEHLSTGIKNKLLIAAIEVAEYNHFLNAQEAGRQWRWVYQTHTHWYSIVYLMIEISRRPWTATVERAWIALHSHWLIPTRARTDKKSLIWVPLRKLMRRIRRHREDELKRLQNSPRDANQLELEDQDIGSPSSSGPLLPGSGSEFFRERWRQLVGLHQGLRSARAAEARDYDPSIAGEVPQTLMPAPITDPPHQPFPTTSLDGPDDKDMGPGFVSELWEDVDFPIEMPPDLESDPMDVNMSLQEEVNWNNWAEIAKRM